MIDLSKFLDPQHILDSLRAELGLPKVALIPYPAVLSFNSVPVVGSRTVSIAIIIIIIIIAYRYGIMATAVAILGALWPLMYLATALFQNTLSQQF